MTGGHVTILIEPNPGPPLHPLSYLCRSLVGALTQISSNTSRFAPRLFLIGLIILLSGCEVFKSSYGTSTMETSHADTDAIFRLDLSDQTLDRLPANVGRLHELRYLNISGNFNLDIAASIKVACQLPNLNTLILDNLALHTLPMGIRKCTNLTHLSLAENPDLNLNQGLGHLSNLALKFLNLSSNELKTLPESISTFATLEDLRLSNNSLADSRLFLSLGKIATLNSLWLDQNQLERIPQSIKNMGQLRYLFLDENNLSDLPQQMQFMDELRVLHVGHNRFTSIPKVVEVMPKLTVLFIAENQITYIDANAFNRQISLSGIVLDGNQLNANNVRALRRSTQHFFLFSAENQH